LIIVMTAICKFTLLIICVWAVARKIRTARFRMIASEQLEMPSSAEESSAYGVARSLGSRFSTVEMAAYGKVTAAEFMWNWFTIDPHLISAADFASTESIRNGLDFANYIHTHYDNLSAVGKEGFAARLEGYLAEQHVAAAFERLGHQVQIAETANQPVWDLLVDEQTVNVKDVAHLGSIKTDALTHPDVTYIVPNHISADGIDNILPMPELDHSAIKDSVKDGISSALGEGVLQSLGIHLPFVTVGFAAYRNYRLVRDFGQEPTEAVRHALIESAGRGTGVVAGAKAGGLAGFAAAGPLGAAVGAVVLGIAGAIAGDKAAQWFKSRPLRAALAQLESDLNVFGKKFKNKLDFLRRRLQDSIDRDVQARSSLADEISRRWSSWKTWLWPDYYTISLEESLKPADDSIAHQQEIFNKAAAILDEVEREGDWKKLGLFMANEPMLREAVGYPTKLLEKLKESRKRVLRERKRLDPGFDITL